MNGSAIIAEGLSKQYKLGLRADRRSSAVRAIADLAAYPLRRLRSLGERATEREQLWALKDVSFEIAPGEVVGVVGRNGAGKSTLLKILSRITEPTAGRAVLRGRVGSLLEVGTGFHPELTGRENVYLNGAILGMKKAEIDRKFDEIVAFAEIERFLDTPVKRYSSGMHVRLAFAVAAHLQPEILLVDEVLAVGDIGFQQKCLGKIEDVSANGRTVLFVSHNMAMVESLCSRAILLRGGRMVLDGSVEQVVCAYMEELQDRAGIVLRERTDRQGSAEIRFTDCRILNNAGEVVSHVASGEDCILSLEYESRRGASLSGVSFGATFLNHGAHLFSVGTELTGESYDQVPSTGRVLCRIPRLPLSPGRYLFNLICRVRGTIADWVLSAGELAVTEGDFFRTGRLPPSSHAGALVGHSWSLDAG